MTTYGRTLDLAPPLVAAPRAQRTRQGEQRLLAIGAGTSARELQERLGHSDVRVTLGTYVHTLGEQRRETSERIAARIFGE